MAITVDEKAGDGSQEAAPARNGVASTCCPSRGALPSPPPTGHRSCGPPAELRHRVIVSILAVLAVALRCFIFYNQLTAVAFHPIQQAIEVYRAKNSGR